MEDLLKNKKTCPEETIYQIGTIEESAPPEILLQIANDFFGEMKKQVRHSCAYSELGIASG